MAQTITHRNLDVMVSAIKVQFLKPIFEDDFVELRSCKYELSVEVTHPLLHWQCGNQNGVKLLKWVGCSGEHIEIPTELKEKIADMQKLATMTDEQARNLSAENQRAFAHAMYELGIE